MKEKIIHYVAGGVVAHYHYEQWNYLILKQQRCDLDKPRWTIPKGHLEIGESVEQAAKREIEEETGLNNLQLVTHLGVLIQEMTWKNILDERIMYIDVLKENKECLKITHNMLFISPSTGVVISRDEGFVGIQWINLKNIDEYLSKDHLFYPVIIKADSILNAFNTNK